MRKQGKHPQDALTDRFCKNAPHGKHADGRGLYLVVDDHGKRWVFRYTFKGRRRQKGEGSYLDVPLKKARERRTRNRALLIDGIDPIEHEKSANRVTLTFKEAAHEVHLQNLPNWKNTKHAAQWINTLKEYAFPHFGDTPIDQVGTGDVLKALSPIWLTKHETAKRVRQRIGSVLDWAKAHEHRTGDNPVSEISEALPKVRYRVKSHAAMPHEDVRSFLLALKQFNTRLVVKLSLELLIRTATRSGEVRLAKWDEVDFDNKVWTIPGDRMKGGRAHKVPLAPRCIDILREAEKFNSEYVFPGRKADSCLSDMAFTMLLRRMEVQATAHGFRSTFRDWAEEKTSFKRSAIEASLAHTIADSSTEGAYLRTQMFADRVQLMNEWGVYCG